MLDAHKEDASESSKGLTDQEIVAQAITFLLAGYETTSNALSYTSYLLALHPEVQEKLAREIEEYFEDKPVSWSTCMARHMEHLSHMQCALFPLNLSWCHAGEHSVRGFSGH